MTRIALFTAVCDADAGMAVPALLSVMKALEGHSVRLCIVDDASVHNVGKRTSSALSSWSDWQPAVIRLPSPLGFRGCSERTRISLKWIAETWPDVELVIHTDPDTLVLRPGLADVVEAMATRPGTMQGFTRKMRLKDRLAYCMDLLPVGLARRIIGGRIAHSYRRIRLRPVWWASAGRSALRRGFNFRFAGGGFYAFSGDLLRRIHGAGHLHVSALGNHGLITSEEDVIASTLVCSVGGRVCDLRDMYPNLGSLAVGDWTPEGLVASGARIVHPIKANGESQTRVERLLRLLELPSPLYW